MIIYYIKLICLSERKKDYKCSVMRYIYVKVYINTLFFHHHHHHIVVVSSQINLSLFFSPPVCLSYISLSYIIKNNDKSLFVLFFFLDFLACYYIFVVVVCVYVYDALYTVILMRLMRR